MEFEVALITKFNLNSALFDLIYELRAKFEPFPIANQIGGSPVVASKIDKVQLDLAKKSCLLVDR